MNQDSEEPWDNASNGSDTKLLIVASYRALGRSPQGGYCDLGWIEEQLEVVNLN